MMGYMSGVQIFAKFSAGKLKFCRVFLKLSVFLTFYNIAIVSKEMCSITYRNCLCFARFTIAEIYAGCYFRYFAKIWTSQ